MRAIESRFEDQSRSRIPVLLFALISLVLCRDASAQSPEEVFRRLRGVSLGVVELRPLTISSVAVDNWDSTGEGTSYSVRLLLSGELTVHGDPAHSTTPVLKGPFRGQLIGTVLTERGNREAIVKISVEKGGLNLDLGSSATTSFSPLGDQAIAAGSFHVTNTSPVSMGIAGGSGALVLTSAQPKVRITGALPLGSAQKSTEVTSTAYLKGKIDLSAPAILWQPADFRLKPGTIGVSLDSPAFRIEAPEAAFKTGRVHVESGLLTTILEDVAVARPSVALRNHDTTPIDAVAEALVGRLETTFKLGDQPQFALGGPGQVVLKPDHERIVDLVNDYKRLPNQYVPTGNVTVPLVSSHALRQFHEALRDAAMATTGEHHILLTVNDSGAIASTHRAVEESEAGKYFCLTVAWTAKAVIDSAQIVAIGQSLLPLGLAAGLTVGAVTVPVLTPFVTAAVVGVGAIGGWAALEYWSGVLEDETGLPGAPTFTPAAIARSLIEKGFTNACQVAVQSITGTSRVPRKAGDLATLSPRLPGEANAAVRARREAELETARKKWLPMPQAAQKTLLEKHACCNYHDFHRAILRDQQIWREYATQRARRTGDEIRMADENRVASWVIQQRNNLAQSRNEEVAAERIRAAAEASLRQAIGGSGPVLEYSSTMGWSVSGGGIPGGTLGGGTGGQGGGTCGACNCALNCMSIEVKKP